MKKYKKILLIFFILLAGLTAANFVLAQSKDPIGLNTYANNLGLEAGKVMDPKQILVNIVKYLLTFVGLIAMVMVLYGGFLWMTSNGDAEKVTKAKKVLISAVIGLAIIISSYFIVSFIVTSADPDPNPPGPTDNSCKTQGCPGGQTCCTILGGSFCSDDCSSSAAFHITGTVPRDESKNVIRNVVVKVFFNKKIDSSVTSQIVLNNNFKISKIADIDPASSTHEILLPSAVPVALTAVATSSDGRGMSVKAVQACGNEQNTQNCFTSWSRYRVTISNGIAAVGPEYLNCTVGICEFDFITNNLIDTSGPKAGIVPTQICKDDGTLPSNANRIGGWGSDDVGISEINFYMQQKGFPFPSLVPPSPFVGNQTPYQYAEVKINTTSFTIGDEYVFTVNAQDMSGAAEIASSTSKVRLGHCCNNKKDLDEEDVDCGGKDCDSCENQSPIIMLLSPDNGANQTWVTIFGKYFGSVAGTVWFSSATNTPFDIKAEYPSPLENSRCTRNWQTSQIVVKVPLGAHTGPIKVVKADNRLDTTDNNFGPFVPDFKVNSVTRPGICLLEPDAGFLNDAFQIQGYRLGASGAGQKVYFGDSASATLSFLANSVFYNDTYATATVPNVVYGRNMAYVVSGTSSNSLYFEVKNNQTQAPIIDYLDPETGPIGTYVTINGSGFGFYNAKNSKVSLTLNGVTFFMASSTDFPKECRNSWWGDKQIVFKVPALTPTTGVYNVTVTNNYGTSTPKTFTVTSGSPGPGICLLKPHNGSIGYQIDVFGDNFGDAKPAGGFVRFYNRKTGIDTAWTKQNIKVPVPVGAQTGPVDVSDGVHVSNRLQFTVGLCSSVADCYSNEVCCGGGTVYSGICRPVGECGGTIGMTGFGWKFNVLGDVPYYTCGGYGDQASCDAAGKCPNSLGACSNRSNLDLGKACSNDACNKSFSQCGGQCVYTTDNRCELPPVQTCSSVYPNPTNPDDTYAKAVCRKVGSVPYWQIEQGRNCPSGTFLDINGWCTIGTALVPATCSLCPSGFMCAGNKCVINSQVCPSGSACKDTNNVATLDGNCVLSHNICECCCDSTNSNRDCCAGLTCTSGGCGGGAPYGLCTGCTVAGNQEASDKACNCDGTVGKYCDMTAASGNGACKDKTPCDSNLNNDVCDPGACPSGEVCDTDCYCKKGKPCSTSLVTPSLQADGSYAPTCNAASNCDPLREDCDPKDCFCKKKKVPAGDSCDVDLSSIINCDPFHCDVAYRCLSDDTQKPCGNCCCDVALSNGADDTCKRLGKDMLCKTNTDTGANAICKDTSSALPDIGICCGCKNDSDCGDVVSTGCGADTCCRPRPEVLEVAPDDDATGICRNASIKVVFNDLMDISSFVGNVIVLGDYGTEKCPAGTEFLALAGEKEKVLGFWEKIALEMKRIGRIVMEPIIGKERALAYTAPTEKNYCAVKGSTSGLNSGGQTTLYFQVAKPLDSNRLHYVILKGGDSKGIKNSFGVVYNPENSPGAWQNIFPLSSPSDSSLTFNKIKYTGSAIWSFTTLPDSSPNKGVCVLDKVEVKPDSYLFQANKDNSGDNNLLSASFDTITDSDKAFMAIGKSVSSQAIVRIPGFYDWTWTWSSGNTSIIGINSSIFSADNEKTIVFANPAAVEGQSIITATAAGVNLTMPIKGTANAYLFICENPWPPVTANGSWSPWGDTNANCAAPFNTDCQNTNYQMYYCRDNGGTGSLDDLPSIASSTVVNLSQKFTCSIAGGTACGSISSTCTGGTCDANKVCSSPEGTCVNTSGPCAGTCKAVIKESFFFRSEVPNYFQQLATTTSKTNPVGVNKSGEAYFYWNTFPSKPSEVFNYYKLYYGLSSGSYISFKKFKESDCSHTEASPCTVTGLTNNVTYYFSLTASYVSGAESTTSNEVLFTPKDLGKPNSPTNFKATASDRSVILSWDAPSGGARSYNVYYGVSVPSAPARSSDFASSQNVGNVKGVTISGLTNGQRYYFAVSAVGTSSVESDLVATPLGVSPISALSLEVFPGDAKVTLKWTVVSGAMFYDIYQGPTADNLSQLSPLSTDYKNLTSTEKDIILTSADNGVIKYYAIKAKKSVSDSDITASSNVVAGVSLARANIDTVTPVGNNSMKVSWNVVPGASSYLLYYGIKSGVYGNPINTGNTTNYTISNLYAGLGYYYALKTADANGNGSSISAEKMSGILLTTSVIKDVQVASGTISLSWDNIVGTSDYLISYGTTTPGVYKKQIHVGYVNSYTLTKLVNGQNYYIVLKAFDINGNGSATSTMRTAVPNP